MEPFNFGRTLSRAFALMRDSLASVGVFILVLQLINGAISFVTQQQLVAAIADAAETAEPGAAPLAMFASPWYWGSILTSLVIGSLLYAGATAGFLKVTRGEPASLGDCFQAGIAKFLPVLGLTILWWLGVALGWMLLLIPGLILITMWSAALPTLIGERLGVIESFGRSRELTKGSRLSIFGVLFLSVIILYIPMLFLGGAVAGGMMGGMGSMRDLTSGAAFGAMSLLISIPYGWFAGMLLTSLLVSIYTETTLIKGGGSTVQLSDEFV